ncbi:josephin-2-like [Dendronephthya gigantea]|uniref:josephin-2-like n=1 Tax=Dendronephthya gigantea TaxID=151771 RepID=UPI00106CDBFA|nr:josephin-2-like [Dendronephthya gigantea]
MYHERQSLQFCALHVLNNLFQERVFSKQELDDICYSLNPDATINPHKSMFGLGNYDVNVLTVALQLKDYEFIWFDKRIDLTSLDLTNIYGIVLNKFYKPKCLGLEIPIKRRHWLAIQKVDESFYNLDSKLDVPKYIGNEDDLIKFLRSELEVTATQLFLVVSNSLPKDSWMKMS